MFKNIKKAISTLIILSLLTACSINNQNDSSNVSTTQNTTTNVAQTTLNADNMNLQNYSNQKIIWGPGRAENNARPNDPVTLQEKYHELGAKFIMEDEKFVCLTFDEGYENGYTPSILDTLKNKQVKAIFFVTYDFVKDNPDLIERMIDEGHIIGNHTYRHYTMDDVSLQEATEEIEFLDNYMKDNFKYRMTYFRFPKGEFSESTLALADKLGYKSVFWSFAYADWTEESTISNQDAFDTIINHIHNGEIMLLHAVSKTNADILADVIDEIKNQGYKFTVEL